MLLRVSSLPVQHDPQTRCLLQINGMTTENLSLLETKHLVEKSKGKLTMLVLRDQRQFLVNIPEVDDSPANSDDDDGRDDSSSELEGESGCPESGHVTCSGVTRETARCFGDSSS